MKIAIVGTGIAGLTVAHHLRRHHDLTLFEADARIGGHTHTVPVQLGHQTLAVDTGFIVFNPVNYPRFTALLEKLGVASQPTDMSFSVRCDRTGIEYGSATLGAVFAQRPNLVRPRFLGMLADVRRFHRAAVESGLPPDTETVAGYVERHGFGRAFLDHFLVPLGAALWSSPPRRFLAFPMRFVIEFLGHHAMLQMGRQPVWRVVRGGSARYLGPLTRGLDERIHLNTPIRRVERSATHVRIVDGHGAEATFDHVVLACHADQALGLLDRPTSTERALLGAFPYQQNDIVLHTDPGVLPSRRRAWGSWNYHVPREDRDAVSVTYQMNRLQGFDAAEPVNVTLNDAGIVRDDRVIARYQYEHPVFRPGRDAAQRRHTEVAAANRTSFCGAYWGFGFHEDGVRSAEVVARAIDARAWAAR